MRLLRALMAAGAVAGALAGCDGAAALPVPMPVPMPMPASMPPPSVGGPAVETVQAFCGPYRCFARPFWRYRSGAGFLPYRPYRRFGFAPPPRFAPFGFRRFGGYGGGYGGFGGGFGGGGRFGGYGGYGGFGGGRPGGFRRF